MMYKKSNYPKNTACEICDLAWKLRNGTEVKKFSFNQWIQENDCKQDYALDFLVKKEILRKSYSLLFLSIVSFFVFLFVIAYGIFNFISIRHYTVKIQPTYKNRP